MRLKFLSLNIWKGNLIQPLVSFLKQAAPDICALQEVYNGTGQGLAEKYRAFSLIKHQLQFEYAAFAPAFLDVTTSDHVENGNAIFSKYPLLLHETTFYDVPYGRYYDLPSRYETCPRNLQHATVQVNSSSLHVFNTHGIYGLSGEDNPRRLQMSQTILRQIRGKERVILAGDFNLPPQTRTIRMIEKHLKSVFAGSLQTTFNMKRKENLDYAEVVVDMIFASPNLRVVSRRCPMVDVSDHLPLVCELSFAEPL